VNDKPNYFNLNIRIGLVHECCISRAPPPSII